MSSHILRNGLIPSIKAIEADMLVQRANWVRTSIWVTNKIIRVTSAWDMATIQVWQVSDSANHHGATRLVSLAERCRPAEFCQARARQRVLGQNLAEIILCLKIQIKDHAIKCSLFPNYCPLMMGGAKHPPILTNNFTNFKKLDNQTN
jgi:hypothetical protein